MIGEYKHRKIMTHKFNVTTCNLIYQGHDYDIVLEFTGEIFVKFTHLCNVMRIPSTTLYRWKRKNFEGNSIIQVPSGTKYDLARYSNHHYAEIPAFLEMLADIRKNPGFLGHKSLQALSDATSREYKLVGLNDHLVQFTEILKGDE